jgi:hypothetical protein
MKNNFMFCMRETRRPGSNPTIQFEGVHFQVAYQTCARMLRSNSGQVMYAVPATASTTFRPFETRRYQLPDFALPPRCAAAAPARNPTFSAP